MIIHLKKSTLLLLLVSMSFSLSAQIGVPGKAKDLLKEKKAEKTKEQPQEKSAPAESTRETPSQTESSPTAKPQEKKPATPGRSRTEKSSASQDKTIPKSTVELDFDSEPFQPAIAWASMLSENCWYYNITNGDLYLKDLEVSFLPKKTKSGEDVSYASYSNKVPLLRMDVVDTQTGAVKGSLHYSAQPATLPFYDMEQLTGMNYAFSVKVLEGSYELQFWAGTKHFYTYPFQVEKKTNADPYAPVHDFYFLKGPWEDWGRVEFGPDGHFIFNCYLTYQTTTVPNSARWDVRKSYKYLVKLYREGKMVAVHSLNSENKFDEGDIQLDNGKWRKYDATLHKYPVPNKNDKPFFKKEDLKDGNYMVEVLQKDDAGVTITHKYGFTVKDNAVVPHEKADRTKNTNPLQVLEQGRDRFYVKKI